MISIKPNMAFKPIVAAVTLIFAGSATAAEETGVLPEVQVEAKKHNAYKVEKSSNQKFTAPLKDTPKSVTIVPEEVIQDTGSNSFQDALRTVPGITFGTGEGGGGGPLGDRPFIRGFDSQSAIFVDGLRDIGPQVREVFAIEQMEVLKGPSGAFDGRGSAGGSINIVTKRAKAGNFTSGSIGFGTDSYRRATFDGNYMLGDDAAIRLVGMIHDADVPGRDSVDTKRWGFMPSITLGLHGPTSATVSWYHLETDDMPDRGFPYKQNLNTATGANPSSRPISVNKDNFFGLKDRDYHETTADIGTLAFKHAFNDQVEIRNTTRYGRTTNEYAVSSRVNNVNLVNNTGTRAFQAWKSETSSLMNWTDVSIAFDTGSIKHQMNTGVEFSREETEVFNPTTASGSALGAGSVSLTNPNADTPWPGRVSFNGNADATTKSTNQSVYVFDTITLNEQWLLNAGVRYDKFEVENNTAKADHGFFNYQAGVVYKVRPNGSIYASYATSSTPVGISNGSGNAENGGTLITALDNLKPERTKSFEVGTKWDVLDGLSLTAAAFYTQKSDARVLIGGTNNFANAGEFDVKGIEFGAAGKITSKWDVFAGYTHLNSEQSKVGNSGLELDLGGAANKGKAMPGIAKNSASIWSTYQVLPKLKVGGGAFYVDQVYADPGNKLSVPSYVRWDAMASYKIDDRISLQLNLQNLTDKRYFNQTYTRHFATVAPGRLAFVSLNFKF